MDQDFRPTRSVSSSDNNEKVADVYLADLSISSLDMSFSTMVSFEAFCRVLVTTQPSTMK